MRRQPTLRPCVEAVVDDATIVARYLRIKLRQWTIAFRLIRLSGECPQNHTKLEDVGLDTDVHGDPLAGVDQPAQLRRFPSNWAAAAVDVDYLGVFFVIDHNVR